MIDVTVDTSTLINILNSKKTLEVLERELPRRNIRLIIPQTSVYEMNAGENPSTLKERFLKLQRAIKACAGNLAISALFPKAIRREYIAGMKKIPVLNRECRRKLTNQSNAFILQVAEEGGSSLSSSFKKRKENMLHYSNVFCDEMANPSTQNAVLKLVDEFSGLSRSSERCLTGLWMSELLLDSIYKSRSMVDKVLSNRQRFPMIWTFLQLIELNIAGTLISQNGSSIGKMLKATKGDWFDAEIASFASYSNYFIVDDRSLRQRCNFLKHRNLIDFESIDLSAFTDSLSKNQ